MGPPERFWGNCIIKHSIVVVESPFFHCSNKKRENSAKNGVPFPVFFITKDMHVFFDFFFWRCDKNHSWTLLWNKMACLRFPEQLCCRVTKKGNNCIACFEDQGKIKKRQQENLKKILCVENCVLMRATNTMDRQTDSIIATFQPLSCDGVAILHKLQETDS